jgi:molecular chaperone DnaK (HSP70)
MAGMNGEFFPIVLGRPSFLKQVPRPVRVWGIDLGTTNSAVVKAEWSPELGGGPTLTPVEIPQPTLEGTFFSSLLPSFVALYGGRVWVGEGAKRLAARSEEFGLRPYESFFFECKNHMGLQKTYARAPDGFRSAKEIASVVLRTLMDAAREGKQGPPDRVVVTVPASFQVNQRRDTQEAAERAGIEVRGGALLDEPVAAFLDFLFSEPERVVNWGSDPKNLVVFDFGGGTCDVAVLTVEIQNDRIAIAQRAVSRYHRLGGGDIDAAIVYDVLLPQFLAQNGMEPEELDYYTKKQVIEPALRGIAESLKIALSQEVSRLRGFGKPVSEDIRASLNITHDVLRDGKGGYYALKNPSVTLRELEKALEPFLDPDLLYFRETEYRSACSILAPIEDALTRASLDQGKVDFCLLVGGSSLLPQVQDALARYFSKDRLLTFGDPEKLQLAVARGAAWHALALAVFGRGLVEARSHVTLAIRTQRKLFSLISQGTPLPFPPQGYKRCEGLSIPVTSLTGEVPLRVEVVRVDGTEETLLHAGLWRIRGPVSAGTPLLLQYRLDENQVLDLRLVLGDPDGSKYEYECQIENPLTHVANPGKTRLELEELEERIRTKQIPDDALPKALETVADLCIELGQKERAFAIFKRLLAAKGRPDPYLLNRMAILAGEMNQSDLQEKLYREAIAVNPSFHAARFNLALALWRRKKNDEAEKVLEPALRAERSVPYLVLAAYIALALQQQEKGASLLNEALGQASALTGMNEWELWWLEAAATWAKDEERVRKIKEERKKRSEMGHARTAPQGVLPALKDDWIV